MVSSNVVFCKCMQFSICWLTAPTSLTITGITLFIKHMLGVLLPILVFHIFFNFCSIFITIFYFFYHNCSNHYHYYYNYYNLDVKDRDLEIEKGQAGLP